MQKLFCFCLFLQIPEFTQKRHGLRSSLFAQSKHVVAIKIKNIDCTSNNIIGFFFREIGGVDDHYIRQQLEITSKVWHVVNCLIKTCKKAITKENLKNSAGILGISLCHIFFFFFFFEETYSRVQDCTFKEY